MTQCTMSSENYKPGDITRATEVARYFKVQPDTVYKWCARGLLPHYKVGKCIRLRWDDVLEFFNRHRIEAKR